MHSGRITLTLTSLATAAMLVAAAPALADRGPGGGHDHRSPAHHHGGHHGQHGHHHGHHHGPGHQQLQTHLDLPDGFQPEGIATKGHTAYLGSRADGDLYALDLRTGRGRVFSQGPGTPSLGLKVDGRRLFVSGGSGGDARVVDRTSGAVLASYQLVPAGTPAFINDVVLTADAAWFTDSLGAALYRVPLDGRGPVTSVPLSGAWVQTPGVNNANGITTTPDGTALLVVNSSNGGLYRVETSGVATQVDLHGATLTNGDGLLREGGILYAVQNRLNQVAVLHLAPDGRSARLRQTITSDDFDTPTTIARAGGLLYLPNARFTTTPTADTDYWVTGYDD